MITNPRIKHVTPNAERDYRGRPMALVIWCDRTFEYVEHDLAPVYGFMV